MDTGGRLIPRTGMVLTEHPWIWPQSTPTALLAWHFSGVHAAIPVCARNPFTRLGDGEGRAAVRGPGLAAANAAGRGGSNSRIPPGHHQLQRVSHPGRDSGKATYSWSLAVTASRSVPPTCEAGSA
jgi:hypothetical protein